MSNKTGMLLHNLQSSEHGQHIPSLTNQNIWKDMHNYTVKPLLSGHPWDLSKCPLNTGCPLNRVCYKSKHHEDANFGNRLSERLKEGVRLIGGPLLQ